MDSQADRYVDTLPTLPDVAGLDQPAVGFEGAQSSTRSPDSPAARWSVAPADPAEQAPAYRLGRDRRYLTWLTSDTALGLSASIANFAIPLIALAVTGSPVQAGLIGAAAMVVRLVATLVGGVLADRHNRLVLMVMGCVIGVVLALVFAGLAAANLLTFVTLLLVNVLWSLRGGVFYVAGEAAIKEIVPDEAMGRAQAANQARDAALGLGGGPLGGALLGAGAWLVAAAMAACQFIALVTAMILRRGDAPTPKAAPVADGAPAQEGSPSGWDEAKAGIVWLFRRPDLRGVLIVATIINLGFNAGMTTVIYSLQLEGYSPQVIGGLSAAISAVMLVGAVAAPMVVARVKAGTLILAGLVMAAVGILALSLVQTIGGIVAVLAAGLLLIPGLNAGLIGYQVVATPSSLLGRVNSALGVTAMAAMPLAPIIAGFGLEWVGRTGTLMVAGAICLIAVVLTFATPSIRALPKESEWTAHASRCAEEA